MVKECNVRKELEIRLEKVSWRQMWILLNAKELLMLIYSLGESVEFLITGITDS